MAPYYYNGICYSLALPKCLTEKGIAEAVAAMAEAATLADAGIYNEAINVYKVAWDAATKA